VNLAKSGFQVIMLARLSSALLYDVYLQQCCSQPSILSTCSCYLLDVFCCSNSAAEYDCANTRVVHQKQKTFHHYKHE